MSYIVASFKGAVWKAWMCLERIQECLQRVCLTQKRLQHWQESDSSSKNRPEMAMACSGHIQNGSRFNDFLPFLLSKQPSKWCIYFLGFRSSLHFFQNWIAISPKKIKQKKTIFPFFCTLFAKNVIFAILDCLL